MLLIVLQATVTTSWQGRGAREAFYLSDRVDALRRKRRRRSSRCHRHHHHCNGGGGSGSGSGSGDGGGSGSGTGTGGASMRELCGPLVFDAPTDSTANTSDCRILSSNSTSNSNSKLVGGGGGGGDGAVRTNAGSRSTITREGIIAPCD
jgi:hypothetical protein